jgi:hypothetical protein
VTVRFATSLLLLEVNLFAQLYYTIHNYGRIISYFIVGTCAHINSIPNTC